MEDLEKMSKEQLFLHFEECVNRIRKQTTKMADAMGTGSYAIEFQEFTSLQERYAKTKLEILRRIP